MDALTVCEILFAPLVPFVGHPVRCGVVAGIGLVLAAGLLLSRRRGGGLMIIGGVAWALLAAWERYCLVQGFDIRVDLMVLGPVMIAISIGMIVVIFRTIRDLARGTV
jgi:uncharacterized membrane protein YidH (DUF202 family)